MQIVVIIAVGVPTLSAAFANRAKGDFTQPPQFPQDGDILFAVALPEVNVLPVGGVPKAFRLGEIAFEVRSVFCAGYRTFGGE